MSHAKNGRTPHTFTIPACHFGPKICFDDTTLTLRPGDRVGVVGPNGSGKSQLLHGLVRLLRQRNLGEVGYVRQILENPEAIDSPLSNASLSGSERFQVALTKALRADPDILVLDEPTNHLDRDQRRHLMHLLRRFRGILIMASHDPGLLEPLVCRVWCVENEMIEVFEGAWSAFQQERHIRRDRLEEQIHRLDKEKRLVHAALMQEQKRAAHSRRQGEASIERRKWPTIVSAAKARRAEQTSGRKRAQLSDERQKIRETLGQLRRPETIMPDFSLAASMAGHRACRVNEGDIWLDERHFLTKIYLSLSFGERLVLDGPNGSGKSVLLSALMGKTRPGMRRAGDWWITPHVGFLDQHYQILPANVTVREALVQSWPEGSNEEVRDHLHRFLFRKPHQWETLTNVLSGGERARLALAMIAVQSPHLLILDEVTNNIDAVTRQHVVDVLRAFKGTIVLVSHDDDFVEQCGINRCVTMMNLRTKA